MKAILLYVLLTALLVFPVFSQEPTNNQNSTNIHEPKVVPSVFLGGPRVGVTLLSGEVNHPFFENREINPFITQFGWQFETRYFTLDNGTAGLIEFVALVGGLEQNLFLPSLTTLIGVRNAKGFEFGFGPNLSLAGAAFAFAVGMNIQTNDINIPINFAFVPGKDLLRFSLLVGFNARKSSGPFF